MSATNDLKALDDIEDPLARAKAAWALVGEAARVEKMARIAFARAGQLVLGTAGPDGKPVTRASLAKMLGVSSSTVSGNIRVTAHSDAPIRMRGYYPRKAPSEG